MATFERTFFDYFNALKRDLQTKPLVLGGIASSGPGAGGPAGGFMGYLPQSRITYDLLESATLDTTASGPSLWDNLNHIRYRIQSQEQGLKTVITVSANYNLDVDDNVILANAASSNITVILPTASGLPGKSFKVKKIDSTGNNITISGYDLIDGYNTFIITMQNEAYEFVTNGSGWYVF